MDQNTIDSKMRVLIVHQSEFMVESILKLFDLNEELKKKYAFESASTIYEGREMLNRQDVVISGIGSRWDGDGYDFIKELKDLGYKVIVMTGYGEMEREKALINGADGFISTMIKEAPEFIDTLTKEMDKVAGMNK